MVPATAHTRPHIKQVIGIKSTLIHCSVFPLPGIRIYSEIAVTQSINTFTFITCIINPSDIVPVFSFTDPLLFSIFIPRYKRYTTPSIWSKRERSGINFERNEINRKERHDIVVIPKSIPRLNVMPFSPFSAAFAILEIVFGPGVMAIVTR